MNFIEYPVSDYSTLMVNGAMLVDVREPMEVAAGTLPEAVNIPLGSLPDRLGELDKSAPVVLLCRSGARSASAASFMVAQGFTDVTNLTGGIIAYSPGA